jgi:hypothetical protein
LFAAEAPVQDHPVICLTFYDCPQIGSSKLINRHPLLGQVLLSARADTTIEFIPASIGQGHRTTSVRLPVSLVRNTQFYRKIALLPIAFPVGFRRIAAGITVAYNGAFPAETRPTVGFGSQ